MDNMLTSFKACRRASIPIIGILTQDPAATMRAVSAVTNGDALYSWDIVRGLQGLNQASRESLAAILGEADPAMMANPVESLQRAVDFPPNSILFFHNAQRFITNEAVSQAIWNLRDAYKMNRRALVLLAPSLTLPAELSNDVVLLDEPLPDVAELQAIITRLHNDASLPEPTSDTLTKAIDAVCGLSAFAAEQVSAMSLTRSGLDLAALWERKRKTIEQCKGLAVWRGGETFDDIGGCDNIKGFGRAIRDGKRPPRAIVFIDEIEKSLAGVSGDSSGVSQEMLGTLLSYMQDTQAAGMICVGPPGAAKSAFAKAFGNTCGVPTIQMDLSGMKGSLVGESGENLRGALKVVSAVSQGETLFLATCNAIASLPPELRRRFTFGTFFFDLPSPEEQRIIWELYQRKFSLAAQELPPHAGWTGAEIRQCCDLAFRLDVPLLQAAAYIVPVCKSAADAIERLRTQANGKFISASYPGPYRYDKQAAAVSGGRAIEVQ